MDPTSFTPLEGGWSGETFLAEAAGERTVVRIYARPSHRGSAPQEVDAALLRLVRGLVPVPEVLEVRRADPAADQPALLVTSYVEGVRADLALPTLDDEGLATVGAGLGRIAGDLAGMPMPRVGPFVDGDLTIGTFGDQALPDVVAAAELPGFTPDERAGLGEVAEEAQDLLDTVGRFSLVHSDLNPKNVILDPTSLEVRAVLDWEFAHAGHPFTDLGNLLRFERAAAYERAVLAAWTERRGGTPTDALAMARAADLWALVDLVSRLGTNPVTDRAHALLLAIARGRDAAATP